jgi:hypothetical protein
MITMTKLETSFAVFRRISSKELEVEVAQNKIWVRYTSIKEQVPLDYITFLEGLGWQYEPYPMQTGAHSGVWSLSVRV